MDFVISQDSTKIAYEQQGTGPALILVGGGLDDGSENRQHISALAQYFTVFNYARRGRGMSGDTHPYSIEREIEDIKALISETDGPVYLFGASSGGALVLEAAMAGLNIDKLAVYEVPYSVDEYMINAWQEYRTQLTNALLQDDNDLALEHFMRLAGSSETDIEGAKKSEFWPGMLTLAPTLAYDAACLGDGRVPKGLSAISQPTLVMTGTVMAPGMQDLQPSFFSEAAKIIAKKLPHSQYRTLDGESHQVDSEKLAAVLHQFFID